MPKKLTQEDFIKRAKQVHGDKYDYSKVEYVNSHTKVCIICPEHGEFWQTPLSHLYGGGHGCIDCVNKRPHNKETFIKKSKEIHGDKYDYSKVEYINNHTKVCIICPEHGEFWQKPEQHMNQGHGCPKCGGTNKLLREEFINKCELIHHFKYDYNKVNYINNRTKVCIICPEHGEFWQTPHSHLQGQGCPYCYGNVKLTKEEFIKKAKEINKNKYDYSKCIYNGYDIKVCIICPEHGEFWQTPHSHLQGQGCPYCNFSKLEKEISLSLKENNLVFKTQKTFEWLKDRGNLYLDFYLPDYNIAIECQGEQHFKCIDYFGGEEGFQRRQYLDYLKYDLCEKNGIKILYYSKLNLPFFQKVETNIVNLLKQIKKI